MAIAVTVVTVVAFDADLGADAVEAAIQVGALPAAQAAATILALQAFGVAQLGAQGHGVTFADYYDRGATRVIPHVEAPMALRGSGSAGRLMHAVAEHARSEGIKIVPTCGYAVAWFRRHRDAADVLG